MSDNKTSVEFWKRHYAERHAITNPIRAVAMSWKRYLAQREERRNARCKKYNVKRADKFGSCWSGTPAVRLAVQAKMMSEHGEGKLDKRAETVSQLLGLGSIKNHAAWEDALSMWKECADKLDDRLSKLPPSKIEVFDRSGK